MGTANFYLNKLREYKLGYASKYGILKLGIFGSVARGEQKEDSDVDVCVELAEPKMFYLVHIKEDLQALFGCSVDVIRIRKNMNSLLLSNINRDGIYV